MKNILALLNGLAIVMVMATVRVQAASVGTLIQNNLPARTTDNPGSNISLSSPESPTNVENRVNITKKEKKSRNMQILDSLDEVLVVAPIQEDYAPEFHRGSYPLGYDDSVDVVPAPVLPITLQEPNVPVQNSIIYPVEEGDMAEAESNIVFRPLFSYRRRTSQKRRTYTKPPPVTQQRRQQLPAYRYPAYYGATYSNVYPSFYYNAQYDYVP